MKQKITQAIEEFINAYPRANNTQSTWGQPLVAFADKSGKSGYRQWAIGNGQKLVKKDRI